MARTSTAQKKLGKYELIRELGRGSTGIVWLAADPFAQRQVAIKVATPEILKDPVKGRLYTHLFLNEASLAGKLNHPHIVQIYDAVVTDKLCYIVMEYVAGSTLETVCQPGHLLPLDQVVEIGFKCTRALEFAFRLGITHRDIKPANILLTPEGDIKISDFGAALVNHSDRTQVSGVGSPAYMSPEQVQEEPLDHRTDIYSLGVVLYELLAGQRPFQASSDYNMIYQIINSTPTPVEQLRPDIPAALARIVRRAMARELDQRYPSWAEFSRDLAEVAREELSGPSQNFPDAEKFDSLRRLPFFRDFSDVELWEVLRFADWSRVKPGQRIIRDGEKGNFFCFLVQGELTVTKQGKMLNLLTPGDCFGEMAVFSPHRRTRGADVTALTEATLISIRGEALSRASEACRMHFYQAFLLVLAERLNLANQRLAAF